MKEHDASDLQALVADHKLALHRLEAVEKIMTEQADGMGVKLALDIHDGKADEERSCEVDYGAQAVAGFIIELREALAATLEE